MPIWGCNEQGLDGARVGVSDGDRKGNGMRHGREVASIDKTGKVLCDLRPGRDGGGAMRCASRGQCDMDYPIRTGIK